MGIVSEALGKVLKQDVQEGKLKKKITVFLCPTDNYLEGFIVFGSLYLYLFCHLNNSYSIEKQRHNKEPYSLLLSYNPGPCTSKLESSQ